MAYIIQGFGSDQRVQIGAEEIIRPMYWGTNWTKIRIGMRLAINYSGNFTNGAFTVGVCQGSTGFCSANTTDAIVGAPTNSFANLWTNTWTYNASGYYSLNSSGITELRKVGSVVTDNATVNNQVLYCAAQPNIGSVRSNYYIDILKNGSAIRFDQWGCATGSAQIDCSIFFFLQQLENENSPTGPGGSGSSNQGASLTPSSPASNMLWDSVCVGWSRSVPVIEISDLTVLRFF